MILQEALVKPSIFRWDQLSQESERAFAGRNAKSSEVFNPCGKISGRMGPSKADKPEKLIFRNTFSEKKKTRLNKNYFWNKKQKKPKFPTPNPKGHLETHFLRSPKKLK